MNSDFIQSVAVKVLIALGTWYATKNGVTFDGSTLSVFAGALVAAGAAGWRLYQGYSMKKVPEASTAIATTGAAAVAQVGDHVVNVAGKVVG